MREQSCRARLDAERREVVVADREKNCDALPSDECRRCAASCATTARERGRAPSGGPVQPLEREGILKSAGVVARASAAMRPICPVRHFERPSATLSRPNSAVLAPRPMASVNTAARSERFMRGEVAQRVAEVPHELRLLLHRRSQTPKV